MEMRGLSLSLLSVFLCLFLIGSTNAKCVCGDVSLCKPLSRVNDREEMFVFQLLKDEWKSYPWLQVTTMAVFGEFDPEMICVAHENDARVVLAANFDVTQLRNWTATGEFITSYAKLVKEYGADGINIDIEGVVTADHANDLTELVQNTTDFFHAMMPFSQVTFDVAWSPNCIDGRCYDYAALAMATDFLVMMDYDMRSQIFGDCVASANSPPTLMKAGFQKFRELGIDPYKLVLGLPWYGYDYPCESMSDNDTVCNIKAVPFRGAPCSDAAGTEKGFDELLEIMKQSSTTGLQWDDTLQSPWFNYKDQSGAMHQVWFDNALSISIKTQWAKNEGLRGVGMWTADFVDYSGNNTDTTSMWTAMSLFF